MVTLLLALYLLPDYSHASTYYVATNGSDSNTGSAKAPFQHLSKAAAAARHPGDTVLVMDGTYDNEGALATLDGGGSVVILNYSGTEKQPITFRAINRGKVILDAMNSSPLGCNGAWGYFDVRDASYIVIQGFVIQRGCFTGIRSNGRAHDITIRWNEIRNIGNGTNLIGKLYPSGVYLNSNEYNFTFDGNLFHDIGGSTPKYEHAIYTSASNISIVNNVFFNNAHGWGIQTAGGVNVLIANNTFVFPNPSEAGQLMLWDNDKPGSLANVTVRNNIFFGPLRTAVVTVLSGPISGTCTIDHNITTVGRIFDNRYPCDLSSNLLNTDPKLVNTATPPYDFHAQPGSPSIGGGVRVDNLPADCDGAPRSTHAAFDVGAYAFLPVSLPPIASVDSGASFIPSSVAPGQIIAIHGSTIGPLDAASSVLDPSGLVDTMLAGTRVLFDGVAAPLLYTSAQQILAVVPYLLSGQATTHVEIEFNGEKSPAVDIPVATSAPGIFTLDSSGQGQACILNQDYSLNSASTPAGRGSVIAIYGTGEGQTDPPGVDGLLASDELRTPILAVSVTIGGQSAQVLYAGSVPGLVSGIFQVDARVPDGINSGSAVPVILTVGNASSAAGVTVALP
jgi:uncharacterized protein (TIGR03437 family)